MGSPTASNPRDTPAMRQYFAFKQRHPECLLLFRIGDFYEMFDDDAVKASKALGLTLTQRTAGVPMCGMPYHQLETYLRRALAAGLRVAVCDQVQDASEVKAGAIIERAVTRVLTPGTLVDENLLADDESNVLAAVVIEEEASVARRQASGKSKDTGSKLPVAQDLVAHLAVAELSTGAMTVVSCPVAQLEGELARRRVRELLFAMASASDDSAPSSVAGAMSVLGISPTALPGWHFRAAEAGEALKSQYGVATLAGFGLRDDEPAALACGALVRYLRATQTPEEHSANLAILANTANGGGKLRAMASLKHLQLPRREVVGGTLVLDAASLRALEIDRTLRGSALGSAAGDGSLVGIFSGAKVGLGQCRTAMGKRLLRDWLVRPSAVLAVIEGRQAAVSVLKDDRITGGELGAALEGVQDVARIGARVALRRCTPRDLVALGKSLARAERLAGVCAGTPALAAWRARLDEVQSALSPVAARIAELCVEEPPGHLREGGLIRSGVDAELDESRQLSTNAAAWLAQYQAKLIAEHNLPSLKVGYNKIFGYYIELPKAQAERAPDVFSRRQTLTGAERYITPELKTFEDKVTTARTRSVAREVALMESMLDLAGGVLGAIAAFGEAAAELDVLLAFADKAHARSWVKPTLVDEPVLRVQQGRHPVLDELLEGKFVPNDLELGGVSAANLALITGPNMAGKSTYIRQTALLVLLAHTGCFVPAAKAEIGLTDRVFTRIGADDALHAGQSTFMVEMVETAHILNHATAKSLVVLDEIGRGTSTLDGLSLAWAIAERLGGEEGSEAGRHRGIEESRPRALFATHYHELTRLEEQMPGRVTNLQVAVREWGDQIVFLHRIIPGRADRSYGLHVAKIAGIPESVVAQAREVLESLSVQHSADVTAERVKPRSDGQLGLFMEYVPHPAVERLRELKLESLSPMQAFDELRKMAEDVRRET